MVSIKGAARRTPEEPTPQQHPEPLLSRTHAGRLMIHGRIVRPSEVVEILRPYVSDERLERIRAVVRARTRAIVPVVEGVANRGNISAIMRTAEGLGFSDFHIIGSGEFYKASRRSSQGAEKWLDTTTWDSAHECLDGLRSLGYSIVTTSPDMDASPLDAIDFSEKTAIVFGNELDGVSPEVMKRSDVVARIALDGFVESYNISVAAAITLYHAFRDRVSRLGSNGDLSTAERDALVAVYCVRAVHRGSRIVVEQLRRDDDSPQI